MSTQSRVYTHATLAGQTSLLKETLPDEWLEVHLILETAGPVAVGDVEDLFPIGSGRGLLLPFNQSVTFKLSPSSRIFIASATPDTISVRMNAIPGLDQILKAIGAAGALSPAAKKAAVSESVNIGQWGFQMPEKKG